MYILKLILHKWHITHDAPDSKVHGATMGPNWDRQDPGGPHVGPMNLANWGPQYILVES